MNQRVFLVLFWALLIAFIGWDWLTTEPIDIFSEPPLIAIGSGQAPSGAHCSNF